ncbi:hypothetical protein [Cytophaga aurantiaca]|uniref:hypothetical protein n=1 Tax=Cytophaga aurantiaca TaxID=29530 RepID=UPI000370D799|nr:hypothetical protein [Cytophaga aurantiaca]
MVHSVSTLNWVFEHYLYYLSLCIADTDCIVTKEDTQRITTEMFNCVDANRLKLLQEVVYNEFLLHSEEERMDFISQNAAQFLRTPAIREKVITQLSHISGEDDENNPAWIMFRFIRKVINNLK